MDEKKILGGMKKELHGACDAHKYARKILMTLENKVNDFQPRNFTAKYLIFVLLRFFVKGMGRYLFFKL